MAKKAAARRAARKERREFREVAQEALDKAYGAGELSGDRYQQLLRATNRPAALEKIRAEFNSYASQQAPRELKLAEVAGKVDFDALFSLLVGFFPKLANLAKFAPVLKAIIGMLK